jgi:hypothetical protein
MSTMRGGATKHATAGRKAPKREPSPASSRRPKAPPAVTPALPASKPEAPAPPAWDTSAADLWRVVVGHLMLLAALCRRHDRVEGSAVIALALETISTLLRRWSDAGGKASALGELAALGKPAPAVLNAVELGSAASHLLNAMRHIGATRSALYCVGQGDCSREDVHDELVLLEEELCVAAACLTDSDSTDGVPALSCALGQLEDAAMAAMLRGERSRRMAPQATPTSPKPQAEATPPQVDRSLIAHGALEAFGDIETARNRATGLLGQVDALTTCEGSRAIMRQEIAEVLTSLWYVNDDLGEVVEGLGLAHPKASHTERVVALSRVVEVAS